MVQIIGFSSATQTPSRKGWSNQDLGELYRVEGALLQAGLRIEAESGVSDHLILLLRFYFIIAVMIGGILGLSLANAIFVDEMTADNTYKVEGMVQDLQQKLGELHTMLQQEQHVAWEQIRSELHQVRRAVEEMRRQG